MQVARAQIPDVLILEPRVFEDSRGALFESYNRRAFQEATGQDVVFVQDNRSFSRRNVLRGLHYQVVRPQGKLVSVCEGEIFDVAVDLRRSSASFGKWTGVHLSAASRRMVWIPPGFAHGFLVMSESAQVAYKMTDYWAPPHERAVAWNDPQLAIRWPVKGEPVLSARDAAAARLADAQLFA